MLQQVAYNWMLVLSVLQSLCVFLFEWAAAVILGNVYAAYAINIIFLDGVCEAFANQLCLSWTTTS